MCPPPTLPRTVRHHPPPPLSGPARRPAAWGEGWRLWTASASGLHGCVLGALVRDTRALDLPHAQRLNRFPPSPFCTITWFFEGHSEVLDAPHGGPAGERGTVLPRLVFSGPQRRPVQTWNPGPVHAMMLVLYPEAARALFGLDPAAHLDRSTAAATVLDERWRAVCDAVFADTDDAERFARLEAQLLSSWPAAHAASAPAGRGLRDWIDTLVERAAPAGTRQRERRLRAWTGQALRELRGLARLEQLYLNALAAASGSRLDWAALALAAGFSDQSHMLRQLRRATGLPAARLWRLIEQDPGCWPYRALPGALRPPE
jgi:AraC-like DNA-binding protein